jgi:hypothetical protein
MYKDKELEKRGRRERGEREERERRERGEREERCICVCRYIRVNICMYLTTNRLRLEPIGGTSI